MKFSLKIFVAFVALSIFLISCRTSDDPVTPPSVNELEGLVKVKEFSNDTHTIELYTVTGTTQLGYNDMKFRIRNKSNNQYEKNATVNWNPVMHMTTMSHSGPKSEVTKVTPDGTLYAGYLVEPRTPKVAVNDLTVGVWKMQDMMTFPVVDGYTVKIDPRMPGMGNHGSPNNVKATQTSAGKLYNGKLSLTMTGYWKINLQLANAAGTVLKGEEVTDQNPASSLFFEIEF